METTKKAALIDAIAELSKEAPNELLSILAQSLVPDQIAEIVATKKLDDSSLLQHIEKYINSKNRERSAQISLFQIFLIAINNPDFHKQIENLNLYFLSRHILGFNPDIEKEIKTTYLKRKEKLDLENKKQRIKTLLQNSFDEFDSVYKALA